MIRMLFKTKKQLIIEFMSIESRYLLFYCKANELSLEEGVKYRCQNTISFEQVKFMPRKYFIDRIKFYKREIAKYEHVLAEKSKWV